MVILQIDINDELMYSVAIKLPNGDLFFFGIEYSSFDNVLEYATKISEAISEGWNIDVVIAWSNKIKEIQEALKDAQ